MSHVLLSPRLFTRRMGNAVYIGNAAYEQRHGDRDMDRDRALEAPS